MPQPERPPKALETGCAVLDVDRDRRCGFPEVIFGAGKSPEELADIAREMAERKMPVFATRVSPEQAAAVRRHIPEARYHPRERCLVHGRWKPLAPGPARVAVVCAGTSDLGVAGEARLTLEFLGRRAAMVLDVGVAGLHRLLDRIETLRRMRAIIVVAGMEGALPGVVAGLVACPVVAVPTSVGYGAGGGGWAALAGMLTSCASGLVVVNIDNGFGAAAAVHRILRAA